MLFRLQTTIPEIRLNEGIRMWYNGLCSISAQIPPVKKTQKQLNRWKNDFVFQNEFSRNLLDALNRYHIEGLPSTCSERVILESLLWTSTVFVYEKSGNLLALPGAPDGSGVNVYYDFAGAWVYGGNGYNEHIKLFLPGSDESTFLKKTITDVPSDGKGVMIRENIRMYPFINQVIYWSERMADTLRKIETAQKNAATPYIVTAEESVINTVKQFMEHRDNNESFIVSSGIFPADKINLLPFDIQADAIQTMTETYDWYSSHFRELCSVKNMMSADKKGENLIEDEVNINDQYTEKQGQNILDVLNQGCAQVNKLFGTNWRAVANEVQINDDIFGNGTENTFDLSRKSPDFEGRNG